MKDIITYEKTEKEWKAYIGFVVYKTWPIEEEPVKARRFLRFDASTKKEAGVGICNDVIDIFEKIRKELEQ